MNGHTHRRTFLKRSLAFGAGVWVVGSGSGLLASQANEKLNIGIIGCGGRGGGNLNGTKGENIYALCDIDGNTLGKVAKEFPEAKTFTDFRQMLDRCPELDAVVVSTPDHTHAVAAKQAMELGKHVYCEKPLTHSIREARVLKETARRTGVATQMGNQGHSNDGVRRMVEIVRSGAIGPITEVHAWTNRPIWPQGVESVSSEPVPDHVDWDLWIGPAPFTEFSSAYHPFAWRGFWDYGTGALGDMACHILDGAFWACDLKNPTRMVAENEGMTEISAPNWSVIHYEFPARDGKPPVKFTWYDGGKLPPEELVHGKELRNGGSILVGEKGTIYIPDDYGSRFVLLPEEKFEGFEAPEPTIPRSPGHHADWIEACKGRERPACSNFDYACDLTETVLLGNLAVRAGNGVEVEWDAENMAVKGADQVDPFIEREYRDGWSL